MPLSVKKVAPDCVQKTLWLVVVTDDNERAAAVCGALEHELAGRHEGQLSGRRDGANKGYRRD